MFRKVRTALHLAKENLFWSKTLFCVLHDAEQAWLVAILIALHREIKVAAANSEMLRSVYLRSQWFKSLIIHYGKKGKRDNEINSSQSNNFKHSARGRPICNWQTRYTERIVWTIDAPSLLCLPARREPPVHQNEPPPTQLHDLEFCRSAKLV